MLRKIISFMIVISTFIVILCGCSLISNQITMNDLSHPVSSLSELELDYDEVNTSILGDLSSISINGTNASISLYDINGEEYRSLTFDTIIEGDIIALFASENGIFFVLEEDSTSEIYSGFIKEGTSPIYTSMSSYLNIDESFWAELSEKGTFYMSIANKLLELDENLSVVNSYESERVISSFAVGDRLYLLEDSTIEILMNLLE